MDLKLSNQVFNALKQHSISEQRKSARVHDKKEVSTAVSLTQSFVLHFITHVHAVYCRPL